MQTTAMAVLSEDKKKQPVKFVKNALFFGTYAKGTHFTELMENRNFACLKAVKYKRNPMNARGKMYKCPQNHLIIYQF